jgi:hypothetical protein
MIVCAMVRHWSGMGLLTLVSKLFDQGMAW